ncbi:MAG TPA: hypothetical protein PK674_03300 [Candidatus Absconditabacterales bacterium]|nr:hypothetical protein [Candidatus Absconditabacterales bacterium]
MRYVDGIPKPVIGCDIDDVVFHLLPNLIKYYNLKYGTNKALKDVWDLRYESVNICDIVEKHKLYKNMMPTRILHFLKQKRKDIYLIMITARKDIYVDDTMSELYNHGLEFDDIFMGEKKSKVCRLENVDHFFDDALHNVIDVYENAPKTKPYLVKRAWNDREEVNKLEAKGIKVPNGIIKLTEDEVYEVLKSI